jgi:transcriptional antiterminator RfaH
MDEVAVRRPTEQSWYLAYTRPRMEHTAAANLERQRFRVYLPLYKTCKTSPDGLEPGFIPMFPRYIFLQPSGPAQSLGTVGSTRGVCGLVRFGSEPAKVTEELLQEIRDFEALRSRAGLDDITPIQPGTQVRMRRGAFNGLRGLVTSVAKQRVTFLLELLGRQKEVTVEHSELELA